MTTLTLGRTGLVINKDAFDARPLRQVSEADAERILCGALDAGINLIDTARAHTDGEARIAAALARRRSEFFIATKTAAKESSEFWKDLFMSLRTLKTDCIDIYQLHNPAAIPRPEDGSGLYEAMQMAQHQGRIRFLGISVHRLDLATEAVESGLYDTLRFPFSHLSGEGENELLRRCAREGIGFIATKPPGGGRLTDICTAWAYMAGIENAVSLWGIRSTEELALLAEAMRRPAELTDAQRARIEADRAAFADDFRRRGDYGL
ncbi:MAG: aldo/keto reductase [Clostridiales Family XIII bacterium]|jgi:aryl-alcohol dehydrogenase-like predicted oxidoreductase|nr:aldo/keto reductase [Clostridiales Family XIII bacterium]